MQETKNKLYMMIFGVGVGLCMLLIQNYLKNTISSTVIYSCLIGVFLYLSFVIFSFFKENLNTKIENEKINEQYKLNAFKLQSLLEKEQYFEELQKYKHDIKNNLLTLLYLYENEEYITAKNYLEKLVGKLDYTKECLQLSDHLIINAILNDKIRKNTHIKFKVSCKCSDSLFIEDVDLNMLLSNVLDNAIEYLNSHNLVDKYINVNIIEHQNILIVSVKNLTYKSFKYDSNMGTTKKDKLNHGYGLSIVKNIVNRYDGNVEFESSNNTFSVNILLKGDTSIC
ncbi:GHKL domain-containing protein [uncultured Catenibacterium sp.]|uniref:sensor histidine kinase n=2 Tax=Catenibacterium TaxID=135858 RepID=UPI0025953589|nr:GHKL domain-containing protein [uncultured Catenibacterium sp.]